MAASGQPFFVIDEYIYFTGILKGIMMTKKILILFILLTLSSLHAEIVYSSDLCSSTSCFVPAFNYDLEGDVLYRLNAEGKTRLYDKVAAISRDNDTLYYIRSANEKWIAGFFKGDEAESREFIIPGVYEKLYKFAGYNNIFYYLALPVKDNSGELKEAGPQYIRFNPDQMIHQSIEGVSDFILLNGKSAILQNNLLDYNGIKIPLLITGRLRIAELIDSRIAVISGDDGSELVDLIAEKSVYQYKEDFIAELPEEYNLIVEFVDTLNTADEALNSQNSIYYEILIDGKEENRTETGNGVLKKSFYSKLNPGRYHIIKPERWELDKVKGRYARMNNINQPAELKIFIPENRILKISVEFNGVEYKVNQSVLFK